MSAIRPRCAAAAALLAVAACASSDSRAYVPDGEALSRSHATAWTEARIALRAGRAGEALKLLEPWLGTEPWHVPTHVLRQRALLEVSGEEAVRAWYERESETSPDDAVRALLAARTRPRADRQRAAGYARARELDPASPWAAVASATEALAQAAEEDAKATALLDKGFVADAAAARLAAERARADAEASARFATTAAPGLAAAHATLAEVLLAQRAKTPSLPVDEALSAATRAAETDPGEPAHQALLARALRSAADDRGAAAALERALALDPRSAELHAGLGRVLLDLGEAQRARRTLDEAVRLHPDDADAWLNLAVACDRLADRAQAVAASERAVRLAPKDPRILEGWAMILRAAGRPAEAATAMERYLAAGGADREGARAFLAELREGKP